MEPTLENIIREKVHRLLDSPKIKYKDDFTCAKAVLSELTAEKKCIEEEPLLLIPNIIREIELQRAGIREGIPKESSYVLQAVKNGKTTGLKELIESNRLMISYHSMMCVAAQANNVEAIKIMLEAGFSPDTRHWISPSETPLFDAVSYGSIEAAEVLFNAGADIEERYNNSSATPLLCAISGRQRNIDKARQTEMVKFLLKRGANIHASYMLGKTRMNALKRAVLYGYHELAALFRSMGVAWIQDANVPNNSPETARIEFLTALLMAQPLPLPLTEIVPASVPMDIYIFPPAKRKRKTTVFVTSGLSDSILATSNENAEYAFAEYLLEVPANWSLKDESLNSDAFFWPIRWLKMIGRYPHEKNTFYGEKQEISDSKLPLSNPECPYSSALVERVHKLDFINPQDGKFTIFYEIVPVQ